MSHSHRPAPAQLTDLAAPQFSNEVQEMIDAAGAFAEQIDFTASGLSTQAAGETGLDDFGGDEHDTDGFRQRLDVLMDALRNEAGLSAMGVVTTSVQLVQLLKNRLLLADLLARHPEIHEVRIDSPVVIAGLPRTGTTHLHNLLGADPAFRTLPYWESLEPVLSTEEAAQVAAGAADPRLARAEAGVTFLDLALPYFKRMHEMTADHIHEEIQLLAMDISTMLFETTAPMPSWRDYYLGHDQTPHYRYLRTVLQALQWSDAQAGLAPRRWLLKTPQHLEQFGALDAVFPDSTILVTHRDPISVSVSMAAMLAYTARVHLARVDPVAIGTYWTDRLEMMLRTCVETRGLLSDDRSLDIRFDQFMADDVGTVERIYALADQPLDHTARAAIDTYKAVHQRDRHGKVVYDPAQLGIDVPARYEAMRFYTGAFGVVNEGWT